ncbi:MAG TPA: MFS transporter [Xanthobacteraceae bacterium]|nr:MFS transporter [Xanthobacteraceae bacterium]
MRNRWWIVVASILSLIVGQGSINVFAAGVFLKPVAQELGFGRGSISTAIGLSNVVTALALPFFGRLVDRYGVRPMLLWSIALFALATAALSQLTASATVLILLFAISGIVSTGQCPTAYSKVITEWFDRQRGLALGLALAGVGLGTALIPQLSNALVSNFGWRMGYVGLGVTIFVLAFLPVALFVREPPPRSAERHAQAAAVGISFSEAMRDRRYWATALVFFFAATTINGSIIHVVPLLTDRGIAPGAAAAALSAAGIALIGGRIVAGYLLDKIFAPYIAIFFLLCPMAGIAILGGGALGSWPVVGTILLGLGIGAEIDILSFIISRYFGIRFFGALHGFGFALALIGNAVGASMLGWFFQLAHSYTPGFAVFEVLLAAACGLMLTLGPYRYPAVAER